MTKRSIKALKAAAEALSQELANLKIERRYAQAEADYHSAAGSWDNADNYSGQVNDLSRQIIKVRNDYYGTLTELTELINDKAALNPLSSDYQG